jgi:hypothetical protein
LRGSRTASTLLAWVFVLGAATDASAHRRDEVLQAARISVEPSDVRVEIDVTPGIAAADALMREIDLNQDGVLSPAEQQSFAARVLSLLTLRVDGAAPLPLTLEGSNFPAPAVMKTGEAAISLRVAANLPSLGAGEHSLEFRNDHSTAGSVYLANVLVPASRRLTIKNQRRDVDQRALTLDFTVAAEPLIVERWWFWTIAGAVVTGAVVGKYFATRPEPTRPAVDGGTLGWKIGF